MQAVEDEWERELESDEDLDLLFVAYETPTTDVDTIVNCVKRFGFHPTVKGPEPSLSNSESKE